MILKKTTAPYCTPEGEKNYALLKFLPFTTYKILCILVNALKEMLDISIAFFVVSSKEYERHKYIVQQHWSKSRFVVLCMKTGNSDTSTVLDFALLRFCAF